MKVIVAGGGWSTNVGNAFFNMGTLHILRTILPDANVCLLADQPANLDLTRKTPRNALNVFHYVDADVLVLHGSILTHFLPQAWNESFKRLRQRGTKICFISSGSFEYSESEIAACKQFLQEYKPFLFISRDSDTFKHFGHLAEHSYDGIDSAFFLPKTFTPTGLGLPPYVAMNFDKAPEPSVAYSTNGDLRPHPSKGEVRFDLNGEHWAVSFPAFRQRVSKRLHKFYPFFESLAPWPSRKPESVGDRMIVRLDHQFNPVYLRKIFRSPNSFCWDLPDPYLCLYANADLTLTDRIHAALVTLVYGKPAMLFSESGRARILERLGVENLNLRPALLDQARVEEERTKMIEFLKTVPF